MGVLLPQAKQEEAVFASMGVGKKNQVQVQSAQAALIALRELKKSRSPAVRPVSPSLSPTRKLSTWYVSEDASKLLDEHKIDIDIGLKNGMRFWDGAEEIDDDLADFYHPVSDWEGSSEASFESDSEESDSELEDSDSESDDIFEDPDEPIEVEVEQQYTESTQETTFDDYGEDAIEISFFRMDEASKAFDPYESLEAKDEPASLWAAYEQIDDAVDAPASLAPSFDPYDLAIDQSVDAPANLDQHYDEIQDETDEPALLFTSEAADDLLFDTGYDFPYKIPDNMDSPMLLRPFCF